MTDRVRPPASASDAIFVDEVGIEIGIYEAYRLRTAYQPILAREQSRLRPVAVEGRIVPSKAGVALSAADFLAEIGPDERPYVESVCRALHLRNHHNIGVEKLELFFTHDPRDGVDFDASLEEIRELDRRLAEVDLDPALLVCQIAETVSLDRAVLAALVAQIRARGIRIAMDDFGTGAATQERFDLLKPDVVKIDGPWFQAVCRQAATVHLFETVVSSFRRKGTKVLVTGIEDAVHLAVALNAGADLLQGDHLARPALVGTIFNEEPISVADKLEARGKIVPLFG